MPGDDQDDILQLDDLGHAGDAGLFLRATAVALDGRGLMILGAPGRGKSALALQIMAHGARLVADDGLWVAPGPDGALWLTRPLTAPPMIEARHVGLLRAGPVADRAPLVLAVDLDRAEPQRLPPRRMVSHGGITAELILGAGNPTLWAVLIHHLRAGRAA